MCESVKTMEKEKRVHITKFMQVKLFYQNSPPSFISMRSSFSDPVQAQSLGDVIVINPEFPAETIRELDAKERGRVWVKSNVKRPLNFENSTPLKSILKKTCRMPKPAGYGRKNPYKRSDEDDSQRKDRRGGKRHHLSNGTAGQAAKKRKVLRTKSKRDSTSRTRGQPAKTPTQSTDTESSRSAEAVNYTPPQPPQQAVAVQPQQQAVVDQPPQQAVAVQPPQLAVVDQSQQQAVVEQPQHTAVVNQPHHTAVVIPTQQSAVLVLSTLSPAKRIQFNSQCRCFTCGKIQKDSSSMIKHVNSVHHATNFDCTICMERFYSVESVTAHLKRKHNSELESAERPSKLYKKTKKITNPWYRIGGDDDPDKKIQAGPQETDQQLAQELVYTPTAIPSRRRPAEALGRPPPVTVQQPQAAESQAGSPKDSTAVEADDEESFTTPTTSGRHSSAPSTPTTQSSAPSSPTTDQPPDESQLLPLTPDLRPDPTQTPVDSELIQTMIVKKTPIVRPIVIPRRSPRRSPIPVQLDEGTGSRSSTPLSFPSDLASFALEDAGLRAMTKERDTLLLQAAVQQAAIDDGLARERAALEKAKKWERLYKAQETNYRNAELSLNQANLDLVRERTERNTLHDMIRQIEGHTADRDVAAMTADLVIIRQQATALTAGMLRLSEDTRTVSAILHYAIDNLQENISKNRNLSLNDLVKAILALIRNVQNKLARM